MVLREHDHNMEINSELPRISQDNYIFFQDSMILLISQPIAPVEDFGITPRTRFPFHH